MFGLGSDRADALGRRLARLEQKVNLTVTRGRIVIEPVAVRVDLLGLHAAHGGERRWNKEVAHVFHPGLSGTQLG